MKRTARKNPPGTVTAYVKALAERGRCEGWAVVFAPEADAQGDRFDGHTDFQINACSSVNVFWHHGLGSRGKKPIGVAQLERRAGGIWAAVQLDLSLPEGRAVWKDVKAGRCAFSSGSVDRFVERVRDPKTGKRLVTSWPLLELSISDNAVAHEQTRIAAIKAERLRDYIHRVHAKSAKPNPVARLRETSKHASCSKTQCTCSSEKTQMPTTTETNQSRNVLERARARVGNGSVKAREPKAQPDTKAAHGFANISDFLRGKIRNTDQFQSYVDEIKAASGLSEAESSQGGNLVPPPLTKGLWRAIEAIPGSLVALTTQRTTPTLYYSARKFAETSRADGSRRGGLTAYHTNEAAQATRVRPRLEWVNHRLCSLIVQVPVTNNLNEDSPEVYDELSTSVIEEFAWQLGNMIVRGPGVDRGLGIMNSGGRVSIAKEGSQSADTITLTNIGKMWEALVPESRMRAVWLAGPGVQSQLNELATSADAAARVVTFAGPDSPPGTAPCSLIGRPVIPCEFCNPIGDEGDLILADLSSVMTVTHTSSPAYMASTHLLFLTDEMILRWVMRYSINPMWHATQTSYTGSVAQGPFVTLQTRSA